MPEFLEQVRKKLLDAYDHQNYTYGRLVRKLPIRVIPDARLWDGLAPGGLE
jgi:hypothetical protein